MFSHKPTKLSISMTEEHTVGKSSKEKEQGPNAPSALPNGGTKAWLSTLASFLLFLIAWGPSTSFGAFQDFYQSSILAEYSPSAISWIGTVNATLLISVGILAGPLFDRGYVRQLAAVGCFMAVLGEMMLSLSTDYYQIMLSQGFCSGIGSGLLYVPAIALINTMFTTKRSVAMGLATCGTSLGGIIFPIVFVVLQPKIGFPWTVRLLGFIQLACSLAALPLLSTRKAFPESDVPRSLIHWHAFKEIAFSAYCIANFLIFMAYFIPFFYVPYFAIQALATTNELGFSLLAVLNAGSALGRLSSAIVAPKIVASKVLPLAIFGSLVSLFGWIGVSDLGGLVAFCILFGFFSGVVISANPVVVASPPISPNHSVIGTRLGMQWFATSLGVLVGAPIAGVLGYDGSTYAFHRLQGFAGAVIAGGLLVLAIPLAAVWKFDRAKSSA